MYETNECYVNVVLENVGSKRGEFILAVCYVFDRLGRCV